MVHRSHAMTFFAGLFTVLFLWVPRGFAQAPAKGKPSSAQGSSASKKAQADPKKGAKSSTRESSADAGDAADGEEAVTIEFAGEKMLVVRAQLGTLSLKDRAKAIKGRLEKIAKDPLTKIHTIKATESKNRTEIRAADKFLLALTDADARPTGRTRQQLAADYAKRIRLVLREELKSTSARNILLGILYSLLATALLIGVLFVMRRFFPKIYAKVRSWKGTRIRALRVQRVELLSAERITELAVSGVRILRVALVLLFLYFYLPLVLSFFPWTKGLADKLFGYIGSAVGSVWSGFVGYVPNLFYIAVIVVITHYILKLVRFFARELEKGTLSFPGFYPEWAMPTFKIARFMIFALAAVIIFPYLPGSKSPAFQGISIFVGVLFSFGGSTAISNIVAGVVLTYMRPFQIGHRVKIAETVGDVVEKTLLVTRIRTIKNVDVTVPNSKVLGSHIINYTANAAEMGVILHTKVTIGYDVPWKQVHSLLVAAALDSEGIIAEPAPFVLQTSLDDFFITYELNAYTKTPGKSARIYAEIHQNIQNKFNEAGVEILSPHYRAMRDGNPSTVPAEHLPEGYESPPFKVLSVKDPPRRPRGNDKPSK